MPQMAPLNWLILMLIFIMIMMMFMINNYYSMNYPVSKTYYMKMNKSLNNWKW